MFLAESSIQLVPDGTLLLHFVMICVMVVVLNRTLLRPINRVLAEREKRVQGAMSEASALARERDEKKGRYQAELRQARTEGYQLLEQNRAETLKEKEARVSEAKRELSAWLAGEIAATKAQEQKVMSELEAEANQVSSLITAQILKR
jgi:F-type H+-transporting ATPase subunit b